MNSKLKKDISTFLKTYHKFKQIDIEKDELKNVLIAISGEIDIVDTNYFHWNSYKVLILINKNDYPYTIPTVIELTKNIERNYDFHISKDGLCCLGIPHDLEVLSAKGINLTDFYKNIIYPFFANHQYRLAKGRYANGEYLHFEEGIIQFYKERYNLTCKKNIILYLKIALGKIQTSRNSICPVCDEKKYKRCCEPIVRNLIKYSSVRLEKDLKIFEEN